MLQPKRSPLDCCKVGQCHCEGMGHLGLTMWAGKTQMGSHTIPAVPSTWACSVASYASSQQCECSAFCVLIPKGTFLPACHVAMTSASATARMVHQPRNIKDIILLQLRLLMFSKNRKAHLLLKHCPWCPEQPGAQKVLRGLITRAGNILYLGTVKSPAWLLFLLAVPGNKSQRQYISCQAAYLNKLP